MSIISSPSQLRIKDLSLTMPARQPFRVSRKLKDKDKDTDKEDINNDKEDKEEEDNEKVSPCQQGSHSG